MSRSLDEEARLRALVVALGERRFQGTLSADDACAIAAELQAVVDQGTERRAELAAEQGAPVACRPGCTSCCEELVGVWAAEAELVAAWLREPEHAGERAAFLAAYPAWLERSRDSIARVDACVAAGDAAGQGAALVAHWRRRVLCAFNQGGLCSIYPVRPTVCRTCHALETAERCVPTDDGSAAEALHFVPLERFLERAQAVSMAMHQALGAPRATPLALCQAVYERLRQ